MMLKLGSSHGDYSWLEKLYEMLSIEPRLAPYKEGLYLFDYLSSLNNQFSKISKLHLRLFPFIYTGTSRERLFH